MEANTGQSRYISAGEAHRKFGVSRTRLYRLAMLGTIRKYVPQWGNVMYHEADIDALVCQEQTGFAGQTTS